MTSYYYTLNQQRRGIITYMTRFLDTARRFVKRLMRSMAVGLNNLTGGKLHPDAVTWVGFIMHIPIAVLIARGSFTVAAIMLLFFGLFDTLDGELARLQKRASDRGMFLDSLTDRVKEVLLYVGAGYFFVTNDQPYLAVWAIAACGIAVTVSYVNAWGEVVTSKAIEPNKPHKQNSSYRGGLLTYDVRIFLIIVGLALNALPLSIMAIAILSLLTVFQRSKVVMEHLK